MYSLEEKRRRERERNKTPHRRFMGQKNNAKWRGIAWELTFKQWWRLWTKSGHWHERGKHLGQYCMARNNDTGPYAVGNVTIIQVTANHNAIKPYVRNAAWKANLSKRMKGKRYFAGHKHTKAAKKRISQAGIERHKRRAVQRKVGRD